MALAKNMMSTGFTAMQALSIGGGVMDNLTATGTTQTDAYAMKFGTQVFTTVAAGTGCRVPPGAPGDELWVGNAGANTLKVYPPSGASFNAGAVDTAVDLLANSSCIFKCVGSDLWITVILPGSPGFGTVTSVSGSFTGGLISVAGSPITTTGTLAFTVAGTSGGIPYFSGASTWASSAALDQFGVVLGGGAGGSPTAISDLGTAGQVLTSNGPGLAPSYEDSSGGDVTGPASSGDGNVALFDGLTGKIIKDGGTPSAFVSGAGYWSPLTNGDVDNPELIFAGGDAIMVWTPA